MARLVKHEPPTISAPSTRLVTLGDQACWDAVPNVVAHRRGVTLYLPTAATSPDWFSLNMTVAEAEGLIGALQRAAGDAKEKGHDAGHHAGPG